MLLPKFLPRKGPKGTYSQLWMSRALQSLKSTMPKMWSSASAVLMRSPRGFPSKVMKAVSSSMSSCLLAPNTGGSSAWGRICPMGRRMGVPLTTMEEARPW